MTAAVILVSAVVLAVIGVRIGDHRVGLLEGIWQSMLRVVDPGTMSGDNGWPRVTAVLITIAGIFLANADQPAWASTAGSRTCAAAARWWSTGTLVLGWSPRVFTVLEELCVANENQHKPCIVVMADRDKPEMEEELRVRVPERRGTRIVCRRGDPANLGDLGISRAATARSIVVLGGAGESVDDGADDAEVVKTVLAVLAVTREAEVDTVVAEVAGAEIAGAFLRHAGGGAREVRAILRRDRASPRACRRAGLSIVCHELLDFDGDESTSPVPELTGHTFGEALTAFDQASVIRVRSAAGTVLVNPPMDRAFADGDQVMRDLRGRRQGAVQRLARRAPAAARGKQGEPVPVAERILVTGWNPLDR
ncbi:MAG: hypothetical protein U0W40_13920 [Acidimicrobiia bacterium]